MKEAFLLFYLFGQTFTHGSQVCTANVGLAGKGLTVSNLTAKVGGNGTKASQLKSDIDPVSGLPRLYRLNINGTVTIDVPCVIEQCNLSAAGAKRSLYGIYNPKGINFILKDCDISGPLDTDGTVVSAVVLGASVVQRCKVTGGTDCIWIGNPPTCLIEDCFIGQQIITNGAHCDGIQMAAGLGDWDAFTIRRCRIGQSNATNSGINSATFLTADLGNVSGVTLQDCYLAGGGYTAYIGPHPNKTWTMSKVKVIGNIWENKSWAFGPLSIHHFTPDIWFNNSIVAPTLTSPDKPIGTCFVPFNLP